MPGVALHLGAADLSRLRLAQPDDVKQLVRRLVARDLGDISVLEHHPDRHLGNGERCDKVDRTIETYHALGRSVGWADVRLPGRQVPSRAGRRDVSVVQLCLPSLYGEPHVGAARGGHPYRLACIEDLLEPHGQRLHLRIVDRHRALERVLCDRGGPEPADAPVALHEAVVDVIVPPSIPSHVAHVHSEGVLAHFY